MNDGGGKAGAFAAIALIDVLDDFLAALMLEIDIDIGGAPLSSEMKRAKSTLCSAGSTQVMPRT